jgi:hypothetical protein
MVASKWVSKRVEDNRPLFSNAEKIHEFSILSQKRKVFFQLSNLDFCESFSCEHFAGFNQCSVQVLF